MTRKKIPDILKPKKKSREPAFSFEVFPPKTPEGKRKLIHTIESPARAAARLYFGDLRRRRSLQQHDAPRV